MGFGLEDYTTIKMYALIKDKKYYDFKTRQFVSKANINCILPAKSIAKIISSYLDEAATVCEVQIAMKKDIEKYIKDSLESLKIEL
jgi:hypothetical protein